MTITEALDAWLRRHGSRLRDTKNTRSIVGVVKAALKAKKLDKTPADEFGTAHAHRLSDEMLKTRSASTVSRNMGVVRRALNWHRDRGLKLSPIKWPTHVTPAKMRHLTPDEEAALLKGLDPRERAWSQEIQDQYDLVVLLLETGARLGEICRLKWEDVDLDRNFIRIERTKVTDTQNGKATLFLTRRACSILRQRSANRDDNIPWVFPSSDGGPRKTSATQGIRKIMQKVAPGATVHSLRDTYATKVLDKGLTLADIGSILGHSKPEQTLKYAHMQPDKASQRARELLDEPDR